MVLITYNTRYPSTRSLSTEMHPVALVLGGGRGEGADRTTDQPETAGL